LNRGRREFRDCEEDCLPKWGTDWDSEGWKYGLHDGSSGSRASLLATLLVRVGLPTEE
jgi:hypothetical protein